MKMIPKGQWGLVTESDNTRVAKPIIQEKILYKLKPGEFFYTNRSTGKKIPVRPKNETVSPDNRSTYLKLQDLIKALQSRKLYEEEKRQEEGMKNFQGLLTFAAPSTYIGPIFNNNGESYLDNVISGEGTGNVAGNIAVDLLTPFGPKALNNTSKFVKQNYVAPYMFSRTLRNSIKSNPKGQILVSENYFNSPSNWYRITNTPEVYGIKEVGKNVTTRDSGVLVNVPSDNWRVSVLELRLNRDKEGFLALKHYNTNKLGFSDFDFRNKIGSAHGNTSLASKGLMWKSSVSKSGLFPTVILEGLAAKQVPMGLTRTNFKLTPWEDIPIGLRIGFHTGEMPMDNLKYFLELKNGKYSYQGHIIPDKRIKGTIKKLSEYPSVFQALQDTKDIEALKAFALKYGYKLPKGIERYTGEMLDKEFKRILTQHNTFGRGVTANNVQDAEKFLTTAHSGTAGAMDGMPVGKTGIYTMNGISPYGNYQGVVQRRLDFSGPRNSWIGKNDAAYLTRDEASQPLYSIQSLYMLDHPNTSDYNYYDEMFDYIKTNHPEVFNSSGLIYTPNNTNVIKLVGDPGVVIHGGNPGEKVLDAVNIFTPYNIGGKSSTRGFSHKAYKIGGKLK